MRACGLRYQAELCSPVYPHSFFGVANRWMSPIAVDRYPYPYRRVGARSRSDAEFELLIAVVEQSDRARGGVEHHAGGFDDCLEKLVVATRPEHRPEVGGKL